MYSLRGMVDFRLHRAVQMWERLRAAAEAHPLAQVISIGLAPLARFARDTRLNSDILPGTEVFDEGTNGGYYARRFMAEY